LQPLQAYLAVDKQQNFRLTNGTNTQQAHWRIAGLKNKNLSFLFVYWLAVPAENTMVGFCSYSVLLVF
jgi:hypothetical protein